MVNKDVEGIERSPHTGGRIGIWFGKNGNPPTGLMMIQEIRQMVNCPGESNVDEEDFSPVARATVGSLTILKKGGPVPRHPFILTLT